MIPPIAAIGGAPTTPVVALATGPANQPGGFGDLLMNGLREVDRKVAGADALVQAFAQGEAIPVHQVTIALEQARIAVELAVQVRSRLVESYRDLMNMQL
jgi:flagellar hook-basal body complex protein FliE